VVTYSNSRRVGIRERDASARLGGTGRPIGVRTPATVLISRTRRRIRQPPARQSRDHHHRGDERHPCERDCHLLRRDEHDEQHQGGDRETTDEHMSPGVRSPARREAGYHADRDKADLQGEEHDDELGAHGPRSVTRRRQLGSNPGRTSSNAAPRPLSESRTRTVPLWASAIARTIASPSPAPPLLDRVRPPSVR
jgi:hypothetical protein